MFAFRCASWTRYIKPCMTRPQGKRGDWAAHVARGLIFTDLGFIGLIIVYTASFLSTASLKSLSLSA